VIDWASDVSRGVGGGGVMSDIPLPRSLISRLIGTRFVVIQTSLVTARLP
jgi:hypothetical protein